MDRLLASPHYGERWGRHWLDVARYADSGGYEGDVDRPTAYHYRDFVIQALNDDMPFDEFVRRQLAGDEFAPDDPRAVAATGFLAAGPSRDAARQPPRRGTAAAAVHRARRHGLDHRGGPARADASAVPAATTTSSTRSRPATTTGCSPRLHSGDRAEVPLGTRAEVERANRRSCRLGRAAQGRGRRASRSGSTGSGRSSGRGSGPPRSTGSRSRTPRRPCSATSPTRAEAKALAKKHEKALAVTDDEVRQATDDAARQRWDELAGRARGGPGPRAEGPADRPGVPRLRAEAGGELAVPAAATSTTTPPRSSSGFLTVLTPRQVGRRLLEGGPRRRRPDRHHLPAPGPRRVDHRRRPRGRAAAGPGDRQPRLAAPLRRRAGPHAERLRRPRRPADAPGAAGVAGRRPRRPRLEAQAAAPA